MIGVITSLYTFQKGEGLLNMGIIFNVSLNENGLYILLF